MHYYILLSRKLTNVNESYREIFLAVNEFKFAFYKELLK